MYLKRLALRTLSVKNYLRLPQRGYFICYHWELLKKSPEYAYHYFVRNLIQKGDYISDIGANRGYYSKLFPEYQLYEGKLMRDQPSEPNIEGDFILIPRTDNKYQHLMAQN